MDLGLDDETDSDEGMKTDEELEGKKEDEEDFMAVKPKDTMGSKEKVDQPEEEDFMAAKPKADEKPWLNKKKVAFGQPPADKKEVEEEDFMAEKPKANDKPWLNKKKVAFGQPPADKKEVE